VVIILVDLTDFISTMDVVFNAPFNTSVEMRIWIASSFVICQILYSLSDWFWSKKSYYKALPFLEQIEWQSRIASTVHSLFVFPIVVYVLLTDNAYNSNPANGRNDWSDFAMCLSIGYFLSDFLLVIRNKLPPMLPIILHHIFAGWGFLIAIGTEGAGRWFGTYLLLTEATAPWNNTHWALVRSGMADHSLTKFIGYLFATTWFVFRILIKPVVIYQYYNFWDEIMAAGIHIVLILTINIVFLILLNTVYFFTGPFYELVFGSAKAIEKVEPKVLRKSNVN